MSFSMTALIARGSSFCISAIASLLSKTSHGPSSSSFDSNGRRKGILFIIPIFFSFVVNPIYIYIYIYIICIIIKYIFGGFMITVVLLFTSKTSERYNVYYVI